MRLHRYFANTQTINTKNVNVTLNHSNDLELFSLREGGAYYSAIFNLFNLSGF